jgi:Reverse transcriptase (RNA-dependent DNA polymerase)
MSGRGKGRGNSTGRGSTGRGRGSSSHQSNSGSKSSSSAYKPTKKTLTDSIYYLGSAKQAADYETTTDFLVNYIKKTFDFGNDIGSVLETLEPFDISQFKPVLESSNETDQYLRDLENKQYEIEFRAEYDGYMKRKQQYEMNISKAYAFLWEQCAKAMQNKIESSPRFLTEIKGDPIELLKIIKQHAMNYHEQRYEVAILFESFRSLINLRQKEGESLQDYTKRFKTARDVLRSHMGGPIYLNKYAMNFKHCNIESQESVTSCLEEAYDHLLAYMYLDNSDSAKYGSLKTGLQTQQSLKNDQYPKTVTEANNVLSNHKFDSVGNSSNKKTNTTEKSNKKSDSDEKLELSFATIEGKCYCCGKAGHKSPACRLKDKIPKEEWAINKAKAKEESTTKQQSHATTTTKEKDDSSVSKAGWSGAHIQHQFMQSESMRDWIILDNGSTVNLFCNPKFVNNIRTTNELLELNTNGGQLFTNQCATVPDYGEVWYDPSAITNIFSLAQLEKKYRITFDSKKEDAFLVHLPKKVVRFMKTESGLFVFKPKYDTTKDKKTCLNQVIDSVEENRSFYTERQYQRAKHARQVYHALGTPSVKDFKMIIVSNQIKNLPVTIEDINIAEKIFGPDIGSLKGKTTRRKPIPVVSDLIEVPRELYDNHKKATLCIDGIKINGLYFLTTITRNIMYRTAEWVPSRHISAYRSVLDNVFRIYDSAGIRINTILCDNEFQPLMEELTDVYDVMVNYANPQEHVPEAERNNRAIKERFRSTFHRLPYKAIPKVMVKVLTMESAKKMNFFPPQGGISPYYSPRAILHQRTLDYNKHCSIPFGAYVQAHDEPNIKNTQQPRTIDCVYLRYTDNYQGGHQLLDLNTGRTIKRRTVTQIPITQNVIDMVENLAKRDGMNSNLKIESKTGEVLYDATTFTGVNEDSENDENSENSEDDNDFDMMDTNEMFEDKPRTKLNNINNNDNKNDNSDQDEESVQIEERVGELYDAELDDVNDDVDEEDEEIQEEEIPGEIEPEAPTTRYGRILRKPERLTFGHQHLQTDQAEENQYSDETAMVIAKTMVHFNDMVKLNTKQEKSFLETYSLKRGLSEFGDKGYNAALGEMQQLHERAAFEPIHISDMTQQERKRAMESLIFLVEKKDGRIKARACANGSTQREYIDKEDAASPTVATESIFITAAVDALEGRDIMTADIPNAFVQTEMISDNKEKVVMKIRGPLVDMLVSLDRDLYSPYVVEENGRKVIYVQLIKALYGTLQAALLFYKKLRKDLEAIGFKVNQYDPCVANRLVNGTQQTVTWHVDDLKSSHKEAKVNDQFLSWLQKTYGQIKDAPVKATRGKIHEYLAMKLDYSKKGEVKINMVDYVKTMVDEYPEQVKSSRYPWSDNLFKIDESSIELPTEKREMFHTYVAKGLFLCKRGRPDIQPAIAMLSTRVRQPTQQDLNKLNKLIGYLKNTVNEVLTIKMNKKEGIKWYVDAAFAVHKDMRSHTGAFMTLGQGAFYATSTKQKINTRSSTEAELVSLDDVLAKVLWVKRFMSDQGLNTTHNIIYRDNVSSMKLEENGKSSSGKRTRHFDIKYFYITDLIKRNEVTIEYCPTEIMIADYMTKPLVGARFHKLKKVVLNDG